MSEEDEFVKSSESIAISTMIIGIALGVSYFFAGEKWRLAVIYCESWVVLVLAVIFSILAIRKVEVGMSVFVAITFFVSGLGGFYMVYALGQSP